MKMKDKTLRRNLDMKTDTTNRRWKIPHGNERYADEMG
jgi:hypothetical protein